MRAQHLGFCSLCLASLSCHVALPQNLESLAGRSERVEFRYQPPQRTGPFPFATAGQLALGDFVLDWHNTGRPLGEFALRLTENGQALLEFRCIERAGSLASGPSTYYHDVDCAQRDARLTLSLNNGVGISASGPGGTCFRSRPSDQKKDPTGDVVVPVYRCTPDPESGTGHAPLAAAAIVTDHDVILLVPRQANERATLLLGFFVMLAADPIGTAWFQTRSGLL